MAFAAVTLFTILLYVPWFKSGVDWTRRALVRGVKSLLPRSG
jgi:hypothetical protein